MQRRYEAENIPTEILRSFVTILDTGSFTKAATVVGLTQSAISAQMKRLQRLLGEEVFTKGTGNVTLTHRGKIAAEHARRILALNDRLLQGTQPGIRLGLPSHYGNHLLGEVHVRFKKADLEVRFYCDSVVNLRKQFESGHLDVFLDLSSRPVPDAVASWTEPVAWVSSYKFVRGNEEPIRLVSWPGAPSEEIGLRALASMRYETPVIASDMASHIEAIQAGLGYGLIVERGVPSGLKICRDRFLPRLDPLHVGIKTFVDGAEAVVKILKEEAQLRPVAKMDHAAQARRYRDKAEECRAMGEGMYSNVSKDDLLKIAATYDKIAEELDWLAGMDDLVNLRTGS